MTSTVPIDHLQSRLVSLIEQVRDTRAEDRALRAEVLLAMNQLCSSGMLISLWQSLENIGAREEIMLIRLLRDLESHRLERACNELMASEDPLVRSVGYGVVALRSRLPGARLIADAFAKEPAIVLKRGGRRHLAPHSFVTCMLAGIRDFKDPVLDAVAMKALRRFSAGHSDISTIRTLIDDPRPKVAQLGFVTLASRFMGMLHRFAYEDVVCNAPYTLTTHQRRWMREAILVAPEVVEAIAEPGPIGVGDADFVRARIRLLRQFGGDEVARMIDGLLSGKSRLRSVEIEAGLEESVPQTSEVEARNADRARAIGYMYAMLTGYRPAVEHLVAGIAGKSELELHTLDRTLELSGPAGALNLATALVVHWHQLDRESSDEGPFWRWIDGLWSDDRQRDIDSLIESALKRPDETSFYAGRVMATLGDERGSLIAKLGEGDAVDLAELAELADAPYVLSTIRALIHDRDVTLHPMSVVNLARAGMVELAPSLRAEGRRLKDPQLARAHTTAADVLELELAARGHSLYRQLQGLDLRPVDRELVGAKPKLYKGAVPEESKLLQVYFWLADSRLPRPVGARPATGFAACAEFLVSSKGEILHASWSDRDGIAHEIIDLDSPPTAYQRGFFGIDWGTPLEALPQVVTSKKGRVLATVPLDGGVATRTLAEVGELQGRLETDSRGRFNRAFFKIEYKRIDDAVRAARARLGKPLFRTGSAAVWRFEGLEVGIRPDPAFDTLAEYVRRIELS